MKCDIHAYCKKIIIADKGQNAFKQNASYKTSWFCVQCKFYKHKEISLCKTCLKAHKLIEEGASKNAPPSWKDLFDSGVTVKNAT